MFSQGFGVIIGGSILPRFDGAIGNGKFRVWDNQFWVEVDNFPQAVTFGASAVWAVEGK